MKTKLDTSLGTVILNTRIRPETSQNLRIVAAETGRTLEATVDWLLRRGIAAYSRDQQNNGGNK